MLRLPYFWRKTEDKKGIIPHAGGFRYYLDCFFENVFIRFSRLPRTGINKTEEREEKVTVSLTTFPARIDACFYAIKSLMIQSVKADRIVLWLAKSQFEDNSIPEKYSKLVNAGLEIEYCDDLRSHKKYYYALKNQKGNEVVITFDDDIIYEKDAIEKLIIKHKEFPEAIVCNRGHYMPLVNGKLLPYKKWGLYFSEGIDKPVMPIMPSTGAGCLYPYGCMPESTFDIEKIKENAFTADDLWMRFNSISGGIKVVRTRKKVKTLCNVYLSQREALTNGNDLGGENQRVIERLLKLFPDTVSLIEC